MFKPFIVFISFVEMAECVNPIIFFFSLPSYSRRMPVTLFLAVSPFWIVQFNASKRGLAMEQIPPKMTFAIEKISIYKFRKFTVI